MMMTSVLQDTFPAKGGGLQLEQYLSVQLKILHHVSTNTRLYKLCQPVFADGLHVIKNLSYTTASLVYNPRETASDTTIAVSSCQYRKQQEQISRQKRE
jgi:hypothetical protein